MGKYIGFLILCILTKLSAADSTDYKHSIGWDSGISYRHIISQTREIGVSFGLESNEYIGNSTIDFLDHSGYHIYLIGIQNLIHHKNIKLNSYLSIGHGNYSKPSSIYLYSNNLFLGARIGLMPQVTISDRLILEYQFGLSINGSKLAVDPAIDFKEIQLGIYSGSLLKFHFLF